MKNPILEFLRFSRSLDEENAVVNSVETKFQQLKLIDENYNFARAVKEDLRILVDSDEQKGFGTFSTLSRQSVRDNLTHLIKYISDTRFNGFQLDIIGMTILNIIIVSIIYLKANRTPLIILCFGE